MSYATKLGGKFCRVLALIAEVRACDRSKRFARYLCDALTRAGLRPAVFDEHRDRLASKVAFWSARRLSRCFLLGQFEKAREDFPERLRLDVEPIEVREFFRRGQYQDAITSRALSGSGLFLCCVTRHAPA